MQDIELLAIVEVDKEARILCRAPTCKHTVYKRIHVLKHNGTLTVYGSECFKKLVGQPSEFKPQYSTSTGRSLTPDERALLLDNTEKLIAQFAAEALLLQAKKVTAPPTVAEKISEVPFAPTVQAAPSNVDLWQQRQAAKEAWERKTFTMPTMAKQATKPPIWQVWTTQDWEHWARQRLAGKAAWIDTPEAMIAWKALMATQN